MPPWVLIGNFQIFPHPLTIVSVNEKYFGPIVGREHDKIFLNVFRTGLASLTIFELEPASYPV